MRRLVVGVSVLAWLALAAGPAAAHVELRLASPVPSATVTGPLIEVRLEFSGPLQSGAEHAIGLFGPGEVRMDDGVTTQPAENVVVTGVGTLTAPGPYTVRYLVIGSDGHPIEGTYDFVYDGPVVVVAPSPSPSPSPSSSASSGPSPSPSPEELDSPEPLVAEPEQGGGASTAAVVAIAVVVLVGAGGAVAVSARRGREDRPPYTS